MYVNVQAKNTSMKHLICKDCEKKPKYDCCIEVCAKGNQYEWEFDAAQLKSAKKQNNYTKLICKTCSGNGFSNRRGGQTALECAFCKRHLGPQLFHEKNRKNHKQRGDKLQCKNCIANDVQ